MIKHLKKFLKLSISFLSVFSLACCQSSDKSEKPYVVYEGVFLNNDEVINIFNSIRDKAPYSKITTDYHITTLFLPETDMRDLYGTTVSIHIHSYARGVAITDEGKETENEGLFCTMSSENKQLDSFIKSLNKNFHITGSYTDAAKYTEAIDQTSFIPLNIDIEGVFGGYFSDYNFYFNKF